MLPLEFGTPSFCKKSRDPAWRQDENSSMHLTGQVERFVNQSSEPFGKCSVNVCDHEPNYSSDASSMTLAISVSLGLDVPRSSFSTDSPTFQYEPLLTDVAPMELSKQQAELPPSSNQRPPSEQSVPRDAWSAFEVQNTSAGAFEIRRPAASSAKRVPTTQLIAGDSRTFQNDPSPTRLSSIEIENEQQRQSTSSIDTTANPMPTPKIARTAEPSSRTDQLPLSVQPVPAIVTIPFLEIQNLQVVEPRRTVPRPIRPKPAKDDYVQGCDKDFSSNSNLRTHQKTNSDERRYTCDICNKSFPTSYNLARHKGIHAGEKKFACDICGKSFAENYVFARHMTVHTGQKKFACDFCNKTFIRNGSLARHMRRHTGEKTFACHVCDKRFAREDVLKSHTRTHAVEKSRVSRNDSLPARTASLEFDEQQQTRIDAPRVFFAYPTLVPSGATILVNVNTAKVEVGDDLRKHTVTCTDDKRAWLDDEKERNDF